MRLWLDDVRPCPSGEWQGFQSVEALLLFLATVTLEEVEEISLDHDLGDFTPQGGEGYQAVLWMASEGKWPKRLTVHSANPVGVERMLGVVDRYGPYTRREGQRTRSHPDYSLLES